MFKGITVDEAKEMMHNPHVKFIDVRSQPEWDSGHLDNSLHINIHEGSFPDKIKELDRDKTYVVFCISGHRSQHAMDLMQELGFKEVFNVHGPMI